MTFATATAVTDRGDGTFAVEITEGWEIAGNANGGYLLAIAARAVTTATGRPDPVSITGHYLAPGRPGTATVSVDVLRAGGRHSTAQFVFSADDRVLLAGIATTTELHAHTGPVRVEVDPPELPPPDECDLLEPGDPLPPPFVGQVEIRLHPDDSVFRSEPSGIARMRGWFRLRDSEALDSIALVQAVDAFPPTSFNAKLPVSWTPTVELTAHVRRHACDGWLACAFSTHNIAGGYLETDGEIWDEAGTLVAQSRQLQLVPSQ